MTGGASRIFISYRRDDSAGYAGRLEASLESRLGAGSVFRDIEDIPPGDDFVDVIRARLADSHTVLVLIGPRWVGRPGGPRRIDDPADMVRCEVQEALDRAPRVVPVLLPGATMPTEGELPEPLKPLARRNALSLGDAHWDADVSRLLASVGAVPRRALWPWAAAAALAAGTLGAGAWWWRRAAAADAVDRLLGSWVGEVRYEWGDRAVERFEFFRHAGQLSGTATFLRYPRAAENLRFDGENLHFETRSEESMDGQTRIKTHTYAAELRGEGDDARLRFRLQTTGGFGSHPALVFEARREAPAGAASAAR
jgi:hypothetical protein